MVVVGGWTCSQRSVLLCANLFERDLGAVSRCHADAAEVENVVLQRSGRGLPIGVFGSWEDRRQRAGEILFVRSCQLKLMTTFLWYMYM